MAAPANFPLGNYIPALQKLGISARQSLLFARGQTNSMSADALESLRGSDLAFLEGVGGVRTQNFQRQWGTVAKDFGLRDRLARAEMDHVFTGNEVTKMRSVRARGFQHNANILVRDNTTGMMRFEIMSVISETLLSHGDAVIHAAANLRDIQRQHHAAGNKDTLPFTILNAGYVDSVYERIPGLDTEDV